MGSWIMTRTKIDPTNALLSIYQAWNALRAALGNTDPYAFCIRAVYPFCPTWQRLTCTSRKFFNSTRYRNCTESFSIVSGIFFSFFADPIQTHALDVTGLNLDLFKSGWSSLPLLVKRVVSTTVDARNVYLFSFSLETKIISRFLFLNSKMLLPKQWKILWENSVSSIVLYS